MQRKPAAPVMVAALVLGLAAALTAGQEAPAGGDQVIKLPAPQMEGGRPLMQVLKDRHSSREFKTDKLPLQVLSNLLWAADGVSRADGKRTAPAAMNVHNIVLYVVLSEGVYTYDPVKNVLDLVVAGDLRALAGTQDFVKTAPLNIVYVADLAKLKRGEEQSKMTTSWSHAGFIAENVYLFCASEGLAVVVRGMIDREAIAKAFKLGPDLRPILGQTVGYPSK